MIIVNVYAPCDAYGNMWLWRDLSDLIKASSWAMWCVMGDFNVIRVESERKGVGVFHRI